MNHPTKLHPYLFAATFTCALAAILLVTSPAAYEPVYQATCEAFVTAAVMSLVFGVVRWVMETWPVGGKGR